MGFFNVGQGRGYLWGGIANALDKLYTKKLSDQDWEKRKEFENYKFDLDKKLIETRYGEMMGRDKALIELRKPIEDARNKFNEIKLKIEQGKLGSDEHMTLLKLRSDMQKEMADLRSKFESKAIDSDSYNENLIEQQKLIQDIDSALSKYKNKTTTISNNKITSGRDALYKLLNNNNI